MLRPTPSTPFVRAFARVRPWLRDPGSSGIEAIPQPSSPGSYSIVKRSDSLMTDTVLDRGYKTGTSGHARGSSSRVHRVPPLAGRELGTQCVPERWPIVSRSTWTVSPACPAYKDTPLHDRARTLGH